MTTSRCFGSSVEWEYLWDPDSGRGSLSSSDDKTVGGESTGVRSTDWMEAKSKDDECRLTYDVFKVLQDKRKGTSVVVGLLKCRSSVLVRAADEEEFMPRSRSVVS